MEPAVIALVFLSGVLHVAWNVRLKTAGDPLRAATVGMVAAAFGIVPAGIAVWWLGGHPALPVAGIVLGIGSGLVEAAYFIFLSAAYRRGDLSVVYPIARGTAPLIAVAFGVVLLGERLGIPGSIGVALLLVGFLVLQRPWRALQRPAVAADGTRGRRIDPAVAFALATGLTIATYTLIDRLGTRIIDPVPYAAILWITTAITLVLWVTFVAGGGILAGGPEQIRRAAVGGWLTLGAYLLILVALSVAPLSGVAPLRESATVFAAAWGSVRLGEAADRGDTVRRVGASVLIVVGALLLAVGAGPQPASGRLAQRSAAEDPPSPEPAVHEPDPGDDQRRPDDQPPVDGLLEEDVPQDDAHDRQQVGDERRPRGTPVLEQAEHEEVRRRRIPAARATGSRTTPACPASPSRGARTGGPPSR